MNSKSRASVLLFTLLFLAILSVLTQQLVRNVFIGYSFNNTMVASQQARTLALGGINLAIAQLNIDDPEEKDEKKELDEKTKTKKEDKKFKAFLTRVLPNLNKWQIFNLEKKFDGIDGQVKFCITCENGKININEAFDFQKKEFRKEFKLILKGLKIKNKLREGEILKNLTKFLSQRNKKLDDISELVNVPGLENLELFYEPPKIPEQKKQPRANSTIYLQDLFTIWSESETINVLLFSDSLLAAFGLRRPLYNDATKLKSKFKKMIDLFKKNWGSDWEKNWKNISSIFGKKPKTFKSFDRILSKEFGPRVYSVLSCGEVNGVKQSLITVIKEVTRKITEKKDRVSKSFKEKDNEKSLKEKIIKTFEIVRLYWI